MQIVREGPIEPLTTYIPLSHGYIALQGRQTDRQINKQTKNPATPTYPLVFKLEHLGNAGSIQRGSGQH